MSAHSDLRIAIVGAGPSGLSLAWYLAQLGFTRVEIFETSDEVGGQSRTYDIDGLKVELGTCYFADGYVIAREVARAVDTPAKRLPRATFLDDQGEIVHPVMPSSGELVRYVLAWMRWYLSGQLSSPTRADNALAFDEWLRRKGLADLATGWVFADGCTAQLYGPLDDITAHNGLAWMRPSLLLTGRLEQTAYIPAGFQTMWKRLVAKLGYAVHSGRAVGEVRPIGAEVEIVRDGAAFERRFDHVFIACPLDETPGNQGTRLRHPLTDMLREDFAPFDATEVYSAVWRASDWPLGAPSRCYLPAATKGERGRLLTIRQFGKVGDEWVGQLCAYAIDDAPPRDYEGRLLANRERIVRDMEQIVGLRDVRMLHDRLWRYSVRFSSEQLRQGLPAAITQRQGGQNVWYTGGALRHWDIDMIANFNQSLAWRFGKRVDVPFLKRLRIVRLRDLFRDL